MATDKSLEAIFDLLKNGAATISIKDMDNIVEKVAKPTARQAGLKREFMVNPSYLCTPEFADWESLVVLSNVPRTPRGQVVPDLEQNPRLWVIAYAKRDGSSARYYDRIGKQVARPGSARHTDPDPARAQRFNGISENIKMLTLSGSSLRRNWGGKAETWYPDVDPSVPGEPIVQTGGNALYNMLILMSLARDKEPPLVKQAIGKEELDRVRQWLGVAGR